MKNNPDWMQVSNMKNNPDGLQHKRQSWLDCNMKNNRDWTVTWKTVLTELKHEKKLLFVLYKSKPSVQNSSNIKILITHLSMQAISTKQLKHKYVYYRSAHTIKRKQVFKMNI